jgi:hypothetical protein
MLSNGGLTRYLETVDEDLMSGNEKAVSGQ